jgi:hypothetical protein
MKTFKQIREAKLVLKISNPTKIAKDHVKGKVIKFSWANTGEAGIGTERLVGISQDHIAILPGLQKDLIPVIKKNNIRSFSYAGKDEGPPWLESWVKSNKNLRHEDTSPDLVIAAKEGYDISKDILKMFKDFNKKFGGLKAKKNDPFGIPAGSSKDYLFHNFITIQFIEIY